MKPRRFPILGTLAFLTGLILTVFFFAALQVTTRPATTPAEVATMEPTVQLYRVYCPAILVENPEEMVTMAPTLTSTASRPAEPSSTVEPSLIPSPPATTHVVQAGETLTQIARTYGTTVDAIVQANDLENAGIVREGQELLIPSSASTTPTEEATTIPVPTPSSSVGETIHVVQQGETLSQIARTYSITVEEIAQANGLDNPNAIFVGQALVIP